MIKQVYAFVSREVKILLHDKVALFWVIAWPIFWVLMVAYVFVPPGTGTPVRLAIGVVNYDTSVEELNISSTFFIEVMSNMTYDNQRVFNIVLYDSEEKLVEDLRKGRLDAGLVIPREFAKNLTWSVAELLVLIGARDPYTASVTQHVISNFIGEFNRRAGLYKVEIALTYVEHQLGDQPEILNYVRNFMYGLVSPINTTYREVKPGAIATREKVLGWYVIGAVGMTLLTTGLSEGASAIYGERAIGSLKRVLVAPISPVTFIVSQVLASITIMLLSTTAIIAGGVLLVHAQVVFDPFNPLHWLAIVLFAVAAYMSFGLGLALSLLAKTHRGASSLGVILGLLLSFTTGVWFPKTWMPEPARVLADYSPFTMAMDSIRAVLIFERGFEDLTNPLTGVAIAVVVITVMDLVIYKYELRKVLESA